jgi:hypothetical protein
MKYALGNMLNGAGGLNPDKLSLDLQFATDKVLTARKGPTPVLTRASTATFIGSDGLIQSAAINQARFDHDPTTLVCKGLLIEELRTNLVFPSAALTTQTRTVTAAAHTLSFYGTGTIVLSGVHVATVTGTGAYPTRTTLTFTPTAGSLILTVTGSVTQAQLEAGSFPTSYIPTTTASVVRSADVCSITGSDFTGMYNGTEGTVLISASLPKLGGNNRGLWGINNNTNLHGFLTYYDVSVPGIISQSRNAGNTILTGSFTNSAEVLFKRALAYYFGGCSLSTNGSVVTNTSVTISTQTMLTMQIGNMLAGSFQGTCHIAALQLYKKRLINAKLQSLTDSYDYTTSGGDFYVKSSQGRYSYL